MASPTSSLSRSALRARDALVLQHLHLADAIASAAAHRLFPLVERDDLLQVARESLVRSAPRCRDGKPAEPYLRRCIQGALHHHLRDRVRLMRVPRSLHEQSQCPLRHFSLDASVDTEPCLLCPVSIGLNAAQSDCRRNLLDQLACPEPEPAISEAIHDLALEQLVDQLPADHATALRLTVLEGLSLRATGRQLGISAMTVRRTQQRAIAAFLQQLGAEVREQALITFCMHNAYTIN